ncbi:hypothetical protein HELRODRAFT_165739 [Helobdella robusta]|uniref:SH2 domain-containing protein n=1 Tax=Helobdella robusta TaxID=6412 RepID=T1EX83_HELRO|nr:hypothetical protein HELRODRAFT_165739 [Helobdella robusta]ESN91681.1 hypothetical protein HELRODRAFT_165739 [Helobdella robusta]
MFRTFDMEDSSPPPIPKRLHPFQPPPATTAPQNILQNNDINNGITINNNNTSSSGTIKYNSNNINKIINWDMPSPRPQPKLPETFLSTKKPPNLPPVLSPLPPETPTSATTTSSLFREYSNNFEDENNVYMIPDGNPNDPYNNNNNNNNNNKKNKTVNFDTYNCDTIKCENVESVYKLPDIVDRSSWTNNYPTNRPMKTGKILNYDTEDGEPTAKPYMDRALPPVPPANEPPEQTRISIDQLQSTYNTVEDNYFWFRSGMEREDSELLLEKYLEETGSFVVRHRGSTSKQDPRIPYSLSLVLNRKCYHLPIRLVEDHLLCIGKADADHKACRTKMVCTRWSKLFYFAFDVHVLFSRHIQLQRFSTLGELVNFYTNNALTVWNKEGSTSIFNIKLDQKYWLQGHKAICVGGLGLGSVAELAPSAFLASDGGPPGSDVAEGWDLCR